MRIKSKYRQLMISARESAGPGCDGPWGFVGNVDDIPTQLTGHAYKPVDSVIHKSTYFPNVNTGLNMNTNRISVLPVLRT